MPEYKYDLAKILAETDGGLRIILSYYPQASACVGKTNAKFKIREEKTPSATIVRAKGDGNYIVTDYGDDGVSRNAIQVVQKEENCDFKTALKIAGDNFCELSHGAQSRSPIGADFEKRPAKPNEHEGDYAFDYLQEYPEEWLQILGPFVKAEHCKYMHFKPIASFTYIKNGEALITKSREDYPIFTIEEDGFRKIYQPKNPAKKYRFRYEGKKKKDFIHGLEQAIHKYNELNALKNLDEEGNEDIREKKLPEIMICSGDRDALNACSIGYNAVWLNSESADLKGDQFKKMMSIAEAVYNVPDIDNTGRKQGAKLALKYLSIKTIWLPDWLSKLYDFRGNGQKDLTDYIRHPSFTRQKFKKLYDNGLCAQFWDEQAKMSRDGEFIRMEYVFNNVHAYYFLNLNGFYRFENKNYKSGYMFIHISDNIVEEVDPVQIKMFINNFLEDRQLPVELRNMIYKTTQLSDLSLANLKTTEIDFTDFDTKTQYVFFQNATWQITGQEIRNHRLGDCSKFVWEDEVLPHRVKLLEKAPFVVSKHVMEDGDVEYDITIENDACLFLRYLINTSRIHWHDELEVKLADKPDEERIQYLEASKWKIDGELLNEEQVYEQKMHLINKIYAIGYLMHRYKNPAKPWMVFAMDNKISEEGESHGGSGKSICFGSLKRLMKSTTKNGRDTKLFDNNHWSDGITEHTDYLYIDDIDKYFKLHYMFAPISGDWEVNPKNNKQYVLPFESSPKICGSSNYTPRNIDPSLQRRLLFCVFSDYYHYNKNAEYRRDWDPEKEFGKNLFSDFTEEEWNLYMNTIGFCIQTYLKLNDKVDPPMDNVNKRNLIAEMTEVFKSWADVYFSDEGGNLNREIDKSEAFEEFKNSSKMKLWTPNKFMKSLRAWCKLNVYELNPKEISNDSGRIIKKKDGKAHEYIFIKTLVGYESGTLSGQEPPEKPYEGYDESVGF